MRLLIGMISMSALVTGCVADDSAASADDEAAIAGIDGGKADRPASTTWIKTFEKSWDNREGDPPDLTDAQLAALPATVKKDLATVIKKIGGDDDEQGEVSVKQKLSYHGESIYVIGYVGDSSGAYNGAYFYTAKGTLFASNGDHGTADESTWDKAAQHPNLDPFADD